MMILLKIWKKIKQDDTCNETCLIHIIVISKPMVCWHKGTATFAQASNGPALRYDKPRTWKMHISKLWNTQATCGGHVQWCIWRLDDTRNSFHRSAACDLISVDLPFYFVCMRDFLLTLLVYIIISECHIFFNIM